MPIVVGMAGRVADQACRSFTLAFGCSLLSGQPLLSSITRGRSEAFSMGAPIHRLPDWAFPAVFLSPNVTPGYTAAPPANAGDPAVRLKGWLNRLKLTRKPVFCARQEFFEDFAAILSEGENAPAVLAPWVKNEDPGYGRTRLLFELAGQALAEGHLPLVRAYADPTDPFPKSHLDLAAQIIDTAGEASGILKIGPIQGSQVRLLKKHETRFHELAATSAHPDLREELEINETEITPRLVRRALQIDLLQLQANFRRTPAATSACSRVVVFIDRLERIDLEIGRTLLYAWSGPVGLGSGEEKIPLVLAFAEIERAKQIFIDWRKDAATQPWIKVRELKPLVAGEDMLAFGRILRNPFLAYIPGVSDKALAISPDASPELVDLLAKMLPIIGKGMPGAFAKLDVHSLAEAFMKNNCLIAVRDRELLEDLLRP